MGRGILAITLAALVSVAALLPVPTLVHAATMSESECSALFRQGNDAYERGDFGTAASVYRKLLAGGRESAALHYNLGNAYLKLGELGEAVASYRRAEGLSPRSADIRENLSVARARRADIAPQAALSPLAALREGVRSVAPLRRLLAIADTFYFLAAALAIVVLLGYGGTRLRQTLYVMVPCALALLALASLELQDRARAREAVLIAPQAEARSGPGAEYTTLFTIHEGAEFGVEDERRGWFLINVGGNLHGWVPAETVDRIHGKEGPLASA